MWQLEGHKIAKLNWWIWQIQLHCNPWKFHKLFQFIPYANSIGCFYRQHSHICMQMSSWQWCLQYTCVSGWWYTSPWIVRFEIRRKNVYWKVNLVCVLSGFIYFPHTCIGLFFSSKKLDLENLKWSIEYIWEKLTVFPFRLMATAQLQNTYAKRLQRTNSYSVSKE